MRHIQRSVRIAALLAAATVAGPGVGLASADEQNQVQRLLERGALEEAVQEAGGGDNGENTYLAAQALIKMNNNGGAEERFNRLREAGDDSWKAIGESGSKLIAGDADGALQAASRAVSANDGNPYAHYQVGLSAYRKNDFQRAVQAFSNALERKSDLAYAHFYAGQAAQKLKQTPKMAEHFQAFLRLAPEAPERQAVQSVLRSLR